MASALEEAQAARHRQEVRLVDEIVPFLLDHCEQDLLRVLEEPDVAAPQAVQVSVLQLAQHSPVAADALFRTPDEALAALDEALGVAQQHLLEQGKEGAELTLKEAVSGRLAGLPWPAHSSCSPSIGQLRAADVGRLVAVTGTVLRSGAVQVLEAVARYECLSCGHQFEVRADMEAGATVELPRACPAEGPRPCRGSSFRRAAGQAAHRDIQEVRLQERAGEGAAAAMPAAMPVLLQADLVDSCQPGDEVCVVATVCQRWPPCFPGARCATELMLSANNLAVTSAQRGSAGVTPEAAARFEAFWHAHAGCRLTGRAQLVGRLCPRVRGLGLPKLAALLALVGGLPRPAQAGGHVRAELHLLLVGDPGTGKSQLLKSAAKLAARCVLTSGRGSTAAGLTAAAVKDGEGWALEAGAMVLADGGVCCVDEFDGLGPGARAAMHEAMEQQTVSVAKAGMLTTLGARTSVFGSCNPRPVRAGQADCLTAATTLSGPLLSRFDMLLVLRDFKLPAVDAAVADHVLRGCSDDSALDWDAGTMQQYVRWARGFQPATTHAAEQLLLRYYQLQRRHPAADAARTTVRMLESLVRIAQAHARLLAQAEVTEQDAAVAVVLVDASMGEAALLHVDPMAGLEGPGDELAGVQERVAEVLGAQPGLLCA